MLTSLKNNKSLTFFQQSKVTHQNIIAPVHTGAAIPVAIENMSTVTASTTSGFNSQLNSFLNYFNNARLSDAQTLNLVEANNAARNRGVYRAWEYEKADILMGGKGSADWNTQERQEILDNVVFDDQNKSRSGVRGAEGHHQQNVSDHPDQQANPDNIKFYRTREEHLKDGHNGNWNNESDKPMIDKNEMLKKTNLKRVVKNELYGLGLAVAIGAGVGLSVGFITTLAQSGITPDTLKLATVEGLKSGAESSAMSLVGYGIGRTIGQVATQALTGLLENIGVNITENISKMISTGVVGSLTIAVFSIYHFIKLKINGVATHDALIQTGKQALFSLSLLAVSIAAQGIFGGAAGIIVSVSIGIILISYSVTTSVHQRHFADRIRTYTIEKCYPIFSE